MISRLDPDDRAQTRRGENTSPLSWLNLLMGQLDLALHLKWVSNIQPIPSWLHLQLRRFGGQSAPYPCNGSFMLRHALALLWSQRTSQTRAAELGTKSRVQFGAVESRLGAGQQ